MDNSALPPEADMLLPDLEPETTQDESLTQADDQKAEVISDPAWEQVVAILDRHIENFRMGKDLAFDHNTPLEEVGKKYIISSTIAGICEEIKADVTNAVNARLGRGQ